MTVVRITVLKRTLHSDLAAQYSGVEVKPCEVFSDGQKFIVGMNKPAGFCDWAWNDISKWVVTIQNGGNFNQGFFNGWMKDDRTAVACCTDGFRPVSFKLERIDTRDLIELDGLEKPAPAEVYTTERWGNFSYTFTGLKPQNSCRVRLHFCEIFFSGPRQRLFHVDASGKRILNDFDIFESSGAAYRPVIREFDINSDKEGKITLNFVSGSADNPKISAIEIYQNDESKPLYAVNTGGGDSGDYSEDSFFEGGTGFGG